LVTFTPTTPLAQVKAWLVQRRHEGVVCPACCQFVKVYRRKINSGMARSLIAMYRAGGTQFIHLPTTIGSRSREEGKLRYWGLVEEQLQVRPDGGRAGYWRVTHTGEAFVLGRTLMPQYAEIYNGECLRLTGDLIGIREALGSQFSYSELMRT
jgi:hypothetical protein